MLTDLPKDRPESITLLGERLVAWPESAGNYRIFADRCPHRLAPLSEGRVVDGMLACNYHGWRFGLDGGCRHIPQASPEQVATLAASPRACATAYESHQSDGLLWVRLQAERAPDAAMQRPPAIPAARHEGGTLTTFQRDLPLDFNEIVENVLDPSHVPFAHHGVGGADRSRARPEPFAPVPNEMVSPGHFTMGTPDGRVLTFAPPMGVFYAYPHGDFDVLVVPQRPGRARIISFIGSPARSPLTHLPRWWRHLSQNAILDGDALIQAQQRQQLDPRLSYARQIYAPTAADRPVMAFRQWLEEEGGGGPLGAAAVPPGSAARFDDRLGQHAQICSSCGPLLGQVRRVEAWGRAGAAIMLGLAVASAPRSALLTQRLAALSLLSLGVSRGAAAVAARLTGPPVH